MDIKGIIPALLTPMSEDGSVNTGELKKQVRRHAAAGAHGVFVLGTNGEAFAMSRDEKEQVICAAVEAAGGEVPVYAGTGCVGTKETAELSAAAERLGADALSIVTPYFAAASQDELYEHYRAVAASVSIPVLLYNIPARTGNAISPQTVARLSKVDNIAGAKDSSGNFDNILQYLEGAEKGFAVLSGNDSLILWTLAAGGTGGISGIANLFPRLMVSIYERFAAGDFAGARKAQDAVRPIRSCLALGNPNTVVKYAAAVLGHGVGECRAPFNLLTDAAKEKIRETLEEYYKGVE